MTGRDEDGATGRAHVLAFYSRHPISADHIVLRLKEARGDLDGLTPQELYPFDQDHYGGLKVNEALCERAGIRTGTRVADFCAGLGGPARWMAAERGALVTGVELNPDRVAGAARLTGLVGLNEAVSVVEGDVTAAPLEDDAFDAVVSQEAFLHVPDKRAVLKEALRVLKPAGRLVFTDWVANRPLDAAQKEVLWRGIAAHAPMPAEEYMELAREVGFEAVAGEDLTMLWGEVLIERRAMYRKLRQDAAAAGTPQGDDAFYDSYTRFVDLVESRALGGIRLSGRKPV